MSWLSTLAKIGGIAAAPFSGGASLALTGLGSVGDVLGKQQAGAAAGNLAQANAQQAQDRNAVDLYQAQQAAQNQAAQTDLQRKQYETQNRSTTAKQALLAELLGNFQPTSVSVPGIQNANISGGLAASLKNTPGALQALQTLAQQAHTAQAAPVQFSGGQMVQAPSLTPLPQQPKGNGVLNAIAKIAQLAGATAPLFQKDNG